MTFCLYDELSSVQTATEDPSDVGFENVNRPIPDLLNDYTHENSFESFALTQLPEVLFEVVADESMSISQDVIDSLC
jgi:hypothetical protein